jgi:DNA-binding beta-propeller fold protein YncE
MRGRGVGRVRRAGALATLAALLATATAYAATGDLTQKGGTEGCISDTGTGGACQDVSPIDSPSGVAVSPDGRTVYLTSAGASGDAILVFDRNPNTGALAQKAGTNGCIAQTGDGVTCADGKALNGASDVAVSPDGRSVYVASISTGAVAVFDRNTTNTVNRGAVTQKADPADCISDNGNDGIDAGVCVNGTGLNGASSVAVSPDGNSVYVGSSFSQAVAIFDRDTTNTAARGTLIQKPDPDGCWSDDGTPATGGTCQDGTGLGDGVADGVEEVEVSPDGESVYATSSGADAVAIFDRNTTLTADHGELIQKADPNDCWSHDGTPPTGGTCQDGTQLDVAHGVAVSPDGASVYVTSLTGGVAAFDRDTSATATRGALTQKADPNDCWSDTGSTGACQDGVGLNGAAGVAVSPDGGSVYVASSLSDALAIFDRDTSNTASAGQVTQTAAPDGCWSQTGTTPIGGTCQDGEALDQVIGVAVSPDGASVYAAAQVSDAVSIFDRALTDATPTPPTPPGGGGDPGAGGGGAGAAADTAPPDTQIGDGPKAKVKTKKRKKKATLEFSSTEAGSTFECSLDGGAFEPCTSPHTEKVKKGKHSFEVRARDAAGNVDPTPASYDWKVKRKK